jgi:hypothetical protein
MMDAGFTAGSGGHLSGDDERFGSGLRPADPATDAGLSQMVNSL